MAEKYFTVESAEHLIQFAKKLELRDIKIYDSFIDKAPAISIKKLASSIKDGEEAQGEQLDEALEQMDLASKSLSFRIAVPEIVLKTAPEGQKTLDFLRFVAEREEAMAQLYRSIAEKAEEQAGDREISAIFNTMADGEEKHRAWAQDRLELEELRG